MNNAELIKALKDAEGYMIYIAPNCYASCEAIKAIRTAADALEAAEKRIAELEAQLPKEGKWEERYMWRWFGIRAAIGMWVQRIGKRIEEGKRR